MGALTSQAKNLEAIDAAIKVHNANCVFPLRTIFMNEFEVERLGWEDYQGIPIRPDENLPTGRFRLDCAANDPVPDEEIEAVADDRKVTVGSR